MENGATRLVNKLGRTRSEEGEYWVFRFENGLVVRTDPFMARNRARILPLGGPQDTILNHLVCFPDKVRGKRVFDPFAGSGILGLMTLRLGAAHVAFLDVNPRACEFQRMNAVHNHFAADRYETHEESIEHFIARQAYDLILANPPFVPTPPGIEGTLTSAGGPLGNTLVDRLIGKLDAWLVPGGEAFVYLMQLVDETGPLVTRTLLEQMPERTIAFTPTQVEANWATLAVEIPAGGNVAPMEDVVFTDTVLSFAKPVTSCQPNQRGPNDYFSAPVTSPDGLHCCIASVILRVRGVPAGMQ